MSLAAFQAGFAKALLDPDAAHALASQPAFAVYRNTVMKGCIDALEANYPSVARLVGRDWFRAAAAVHAAAQLPRDARMLDYGDGFADFLAGFEPARELPYLPGVAHLDRCWTQAHAAADAEAIDGAWLAALPPEALGDLRLAPHPAARWHWFADAPIYTIWQRNRSASDDHDDIEWRGEGALLTRAHDAVAWRPAGAGRLRLSRRLRRRPDAGRSGQRSSGCAARCRPGRPPRRPSARRRPHCRTRSTGKHAMNQASASVTTAPGTGLRGTWNAVASGLSRLVTPDVLALASRVSIAAIFFLSGRTKVDGFLHITDAAYELFRSEYKLPLVPPEIAAHLAAYAEHLFPVLLVLGLFTRLSALALLGMTLTIQVFVYPDAWPTHLSWAAILLYLAGRGGGTFSLDRLLKIS